KADGLTHLKRNGDPVSYFVHHIASVLSTIDLDRNDFAVRERLCLSSFDDSMLDSAPTCRIEVNVHFGHPNFVLRQRKPERCFAIVLMARVAWREPGERDR